jgi:dTDP-4-dehydrorhamnose 3,5-epimerase
LNTTPLELPGLLLIEPRVFRDQRGWFMESWNAERYAGAGVLSAFVQDNLSLSQGGVLRGLHYQHPHGQAKLVSVLEGEVWDVAVDIRSGSSSFGRWYGCTLSAENARQLFIPEGYAHGFVVLSGSALFSYKCSDYYRPESEGTIRWDDPDLAISWPVEDPQVSAKDQAAPRLAEIPLTSLPPA